MIAQDLKILFCGINPGLYSAVSGHHFAGPSNRFWPTLFAAGFTPRRLSPLEDAELLELGFGITNLVSRVTAKAKQLTTQELRKGSKLLTRKVLAFCPKVLAIVGLGAYRAAFNDRRATCGLQAQTMGTTRVWLLPNPSGLNAHHQPKELVSLFEALRQFAEALA